MTDYFFKNRNVTIKDAIADLPVLDPFASKQKSLKYAHQPESYFQKIVRWDESKFMNEVLHHESRRMVTIFFI